MRGILIATPATSIGPRQHLLRSLLSLALALGMTPIYITRIQGLQYIYTLRTRASQGNVIIASEFVFSHSFGTKPFLEHMLTFQLNGSKKKEY